MRTVEDESGRRYVVLAASPDVSRVRDVETGTVRTVRNDRLSPVSGASPLVAAATTVADPVRDRLETRYDERAIGLLAELDDDGWLAVRTMLDRYDLCESTLHALLSDLVLAGLIRATTVGTTRGYSLTEAGADSLAREPDQSAADT